MEELEHPDDYMESRCPAWCDRIILNQHLKSLINGQEDKEYIYGMIGEKICMGDHKPIYLFFSFKNESKNSNGILNEPVTNKPLLNDNSSQSNQDIYVYINKFKANLIESHVDLHDFAQFTHVHRLKPFQNFETYFQYFINEQLTPVSIDSNQINLNKLIQSIVELILELSAKSHSFCQPQEFVKDSSPSSYSSKSLLNCSAFCNCKSFETNEPSCLFKLISPATFMKSYLVTFFILNLNGNFFKLKHLSSFLNEICFYLENSKSDCKLLNENEKNNLDHSFEKSFKMLNIHLKESQIFLTLPCTYKLFKLAISEETRLLNLRDSHSSEQFERVPNSSNFLSLNNNDLNFNNLNELLDESEFNEVKVETF